MEEKKRYIVGHRFGPKLDPESDKALQAFIELNDGVELVKSTTVGRYVVAMTEDEKQQLSESNPDLVIEEDQELKLLGMPGLPNVVPQEGSYTLSIVVTNANSGQPISNVTVYGTGNGVTYRADSDEQGRVTLQTNESRLEYVIASPRDSYWSRVIPDVAVTSEPLQIGLKPLLVTGAYDWGQRFMGFHQVNHVWTGNEIKIAVIDTGITNQHPDLTPAGGYNTLDDADPLEWYVDEKGHGTHCAGIMTALNNNIGITGAAPRAKVYSVKVFPGGRVSDLVQAVEWCIHQDMDVISMSLGSPNPSQILAGALRDAYERGITCIAASGNESTHVAYPAALPTVIAVGAIGRLGTFPSNSGHQLKIGHYFDWRGELFSGKFSNFGPEINVCAPGVAILSTVPTGYASWDGTSMACPMISALVALILEAYPSVRLGNSQQPEYVKSILAYAAIDLGLPPTIQGWGVPLATRALAYAQQTASPAYSFAGQYAAAPSYR
jgi:Subtilase family